MGSAAVGSAAVARHKMFRSGVVVIDDEDDEVDEDEPWFEDSWFGSTGANDEDNDP